MFTARTRVGDRLVLDRRDRKIDHVPVESRLGFVDAGRVDEDDLAPLIGDDPRQPGACGLRFRRDCGNAFAHERVQSRATRTSGSRTNFSPFQRMK